MSTPPRMEVKQTRTPHPEHRPEEAPSMDITRQLEAPGEANIEAPEAVNIEAPAEVAGSEAPLEVFAEDNQG